MCPNRLVAGRFRTRTCDDRYGSAQRPLNCAFPGPLSDPTRIAAQIVTGVGFLGGGAILHYRGSVRGLTTAASLWAVAAVGMAAGAGLYVVAVGGAALVIVTLELFDWVEGYAQRRLRLGRKHGDDAQPEKTEEDPEDLL